MSSPKCVIISLSHRPVSLPAAVLCSADTMVQVGNVAWSSFLLLGLKFSSFELGAIMSLAYLMGLLGIATFQLFLKDSSWRTIFLTTSLVGVVFSLLQVLLVLGVPSEIGMPNFVFALGDTAVASFAAGVYNFCLFYPFMIYDAGSFYANDSGCVGSVSIAARRLVVCYAHNLCQHRVSHCYFTATCRCLCHASAFMNSTLGRLMVAGVFGNICALFWDNSNTEMQEHHYGGMWRLTLLTSLLQVTPLFFIRMLPSSYQEQQERAAIGEKRDLHSILFMGIFSFSLFMAIINVFWGIYIDPSS